MDSLDVALYKQRREERLAARGIRIKKKQYRRAKDLRKLNMNKTVAAYHNDEPGEEQSDETDTKYRHDAEDEPETDNNEHKGGHGNTRLPFGLCQRYGIEIGKDWTPRDAWDALAGKGVTPDEIYRKLSAGEELGPEPAEPPKKDPVKTIDGGDGKYYLGRLKASRGWGSRGERPYTLSGTVEWYDSVPEEERGYRSSWLGRFHTKTDLYLFLKKRGIEEFADPDTGELVNPSEMELPEPMYTTGEAGYTGLAIGMKGDMYVITGVDFDGKKKALAERNSLEQCMKWLDGVGVSRDDVKLTPALKKREKERVGWMTSEKKAYIEKDGVKYGDLRFVKYRYAGVRLLGTSEDGTIFSQVFSDEVDAYRFLKDQGAEDVRTLDKKHENPMEKELPEAVLFHGGKYWSKLELRASSGGLWFVGEDLRGRIGGLGYSYGHETTQAFIKRMEEQYGIDSSAYEITDEAKALIESKRKEEEEIERRKKEFAEKSIVVAAGRYAGVHVVEEGGLYSLMGWGADGIERRIGWKMSMPQLVKVVKRDNLNPDEIFKEEKGRKEYDKCMERIADFESKAVLFGAKKYSNIELVKSTYGYTLFGYDSNGERVKIREESSFPDMEMAVKRFMEAGTELEQFVSDHDVKEEYDKFKIRRAEFESKKITVGMLELADIEIEGGPFGDDFKVTGYDIAGRKRAPFSSAFTSMADVVAELKSEGLRPEDYVKNPDVKKAYDDYMAYAEAFDREAVEFGGSLYKDLAVEWDEGRKSYYLKGRDWKGKTREIASGRSVRDFEENLKVRGGRDDYTVDSFQASASLEERMKVLKKARDAIASGEYVDMGIDGSAFKSIYVEHGGGDTWEIKGTDIDGLVKKISDKDSWDDAIDYLEDFGVGEYEMLTKDKSYGRPTDGMRHVVLMRGTDGNYKVFADSASKGKYTEMYSTNSEEAARKWLEDNNVNTSLIRTRGMNPNDDVPRTHTCLSLASFDEHRTKKIEASYVDQLSYAEKKEAAAMLTDMFSQGAYRMNRSDNFTEIVTGHFMNLLETGTSEGSSYQPGRRETGVETFGHDYNIEAIEAEKYGFWGIDDDQEYYSDRTAGGYGRISFKFRKDKVADRTTYTFGDTLDAGRPLAGYAGDNPTIEGLDGFGRRGKSSFERSLSDYRAYKNGDISFKEFHERISGRCRDHYVECQFHGMLTIEDVESIVMPKSTFDRTFAGMSEETRKTVVTKLRDCGIILQYADNGVLMDGYERLKRSYGEV